MLPPASVSERVLFRAAMGLLGQVLQLPEALLTPMPSGDYGSPFISPAWLTWQLRAQMAAAPPNEREAFETAFLTIFAPSRERFGRGSQDEYISTHLDIAWRAWQHRAVLDAWQRLPANAPPTSLAPAQGVTG